MCGKVVTTISYAFLQSGPGPLCVYQLGNANFAPF